LQRLDPAASSLAGGHDQALSTLRDLQAEISRYADRIDVDPHHLQELEERLNLLQSLRRKYGATVANVIAFGEEARRKLESLEQRDADLVTLNDSLARNYNELLRLGSGLTEKRRKVAPQLSRAVNKQLTEL